MKLRFAFFTWLIAVGLNIVFLSFLGYLLNVFSNNFLSVLVAVCLFSSIFSLPGLAGMFLWIWVAEEFIYNQEQKFIFLLFACVITTFVCYGILQFILGVSVFESYIFLLMMGTVAAVVIALLIQRKYFNMLVNSSYE